MVMSILRQPALTATGFVIAAVVLPSLSESALAANLGAANDYNVFIFGDINQSGTDAEGRVAGGGNVNYIGIPGGIGINTQSVPGSPALLVGGSLGLSNGQVNGDAEVGGNVTNPNPSAGSGTVTGNLTHGGTYTNADFKLNVQGSSSQSATIGGEISTFFTSAATYLKELSSSLKGLSQTGSTAINNNQLELLGTNPDLNIFNLSGSSLSGLTGQGLKINAPVNSTVLINVDGNFDVGGFGVDLMGINQRNVLFNSYNATVLNIGRPNAGFSFQGSLLAPLAEVTGTNGNIEGTLIAQSFDGQLEAHNYQFAGNLPAPNTGTSVPTPALLPGLLGFAAAMRKRLKTSPVSA